jgi:dTDP-4-amino-4,6-dideoxygalactose transaminase
MVKGFDNSNKSMISKSASNSENGIRKAIFFTSARQAWKNCLKNIAPKRILIPAYVGYTDREGSGILDPVLELSIPFSFYSVGKKLQADPKEISDLLLKDPDIDIVLLVHYFGWPGGDVEAIKTVCDYAGVKLVEDCAHAFHWGQEKPSLGVLGDVAFYSIHKFLPVGSGGILQGGKNDYTPNSDGLNEKIEVDVLQILAKADLSVIAKKRRENIYQAQEGVTKIKGLDLLYSEIPDVPQSLPVWVYGKKKREKLYFNLMEKGIPTTALYYRLHDSISAEKFPESYDLSDHILNLPIHQDMTKDSISWMLEEINLSLEEINI